jgi:tRNA splicing ligase
VYTNVINAAKRVWKPIARKVFKLDRYAPSLVHSARKPVNSANTPKTSDTKKNAKANLER